MKSNLCSTITRLSRISHELFTTSSNTDRRSFQKFLNLIQFSYLKIKSQTFPISTKIALIWSVIIILFTCAFILLNWLTDFIFFRLVCCINPRYYVCWMNYPRGQGWPLSPHRKMSLLHNNIFELCLCRLTPDELTTLKISDKVC